MQLGTSVKFNLKTHMKYQHDIVEMTCNLCNFSGNRTVLWNHKKNRHSDLKQCTDCDYRTRKTASMLDHQRVKHQGLYLDCEDCDAKFSTKVGLKTHKDNKHKGLRFECPKCDYKATLKANLKIHNQAMHESISYPCDRCTYIGNTPRNLKWHTRKCHELKIS